LKRVERDAGDEIQAIGKKDIKNGEWAVNRLKTTGSSRKGATKHTGGNAHFRDRERGEEKIHDKEITIEGGLLGNLVVTPGERTWGWSQGGGFMKGKEKRTTFGGRQ